MIVKNWITQIQMNLMTRKVKNMLVRNFNHLCTKVDLADLEKLELWNMGNMVNIGEEEHACLINVPPLFFSI